MAEVDRKTCCSLKKVIMDIAEDSKPDAAPCAVAKAPEAQVRAWAASQPDCRYRNGGRRSRRPATPIPIVWGMYRASGGDQVSRPMS